MKYIITDKGEVRTGGAYHMDMADDCEGRVIAAGHYTVTDGRVYVWGESIGYRIQAKADDRIALRKHLGLVIPSEDVGKQRNGE